MIRVLFAMLPLGLIALAAVGCASNSVSPYATSKECQYQVSTDPNVELELMKSAGTQSYFLEHKQELAYARQEADRKCLQAKGLLPKGGVESIKPITGYPVY